MAKHPTITERRRVLSLMEQLNWFFGVSSYERNIYFNDEAEPDTPLCAADITVSRPYQRITINVYPIFWERSLSEQRAMMLHEYCHVLIEPVQRIAEHLRDGKFESAASLSDAVEQATSSVANRLDGLLAGRSRFMRNAYRDYVAPTQKNGR